jgi:hypothetical protein
MREDVRRRATSIALELAMAVAVAISACGGTQPGSRGTASAGPITPLPSDDALRAGSVGQNPTSTPPTLPRLDSAHEIRDLATWQRLAARPATSAIARTEVVKFLVDLETGRTLWLVDTERYDIHYFFARDRLSSAEHPIQDHEAFNTREYRRPERRFEMGSIVHYLDSDIWALELISGDNLPGDRILHLFEQLRGALWIGDRLRFRPVSSLHETSIASVRDRLPITTSEQVFAGVRYQPLSQGIAYGYLRTVRGPLDVSTVRPDQILVLEDLPDEIPVISGLITQELQAPLGHIAVLCATRGTPNMGLRGAIDHEALRRLEGQLVELTVGTQEFAVRPATLQQAEAGWAARRPAQAQVPRIDPRERRLVPVCDLRLADAAFAGAKASQLGEACSIGAPVLTPGGFVVPISHYLRHLGDSGIANGIPAMLADPTFRGDPARRASQLAQVRAMIASASVEPRMLRDVHRRIQRLAPRARWILRSSTNAEDLAGFTGAGLYRSVVIPAGASEAQVADALREVWASVWLQPAYEEREWYRIDHAAIGMAILVQPFVDGAQANGVAITANPFYEARPGFFVNAQALGGSVTGAAGEEVPEQHLIYTYMVPLESEVLSRSSRTGGVALLEERQVIDLAQVLTLLHEHFVPRWGGTVNAVDVEFLIAGDDRHVVILQARPFTVQYGPGQRWE